jgi:DDE superfamily endonuclease
MNDVTIFRSALKYQVQPGEFVEADGGYIGEPKIKSKRDFLNERHKQQKSTVRARHESVNKRLKQFKILGNKYRHPIEKHDAVFRAVAVLTQLDLMYENPLYQVRYSYRY